jgi:hypothetical protein
VTPTLTIDRLRFMGLSSEKLVRIALDTVVADVIARCGRLGERASG